MSVTNRGEFPNLAALLGTWEDWSLHNTYTRAAEKARQGGDEAAARRLEDAFTDTPAVAGLDALAANHELVSLLTGWQWHAVHAARRDGASWDDIAAATATTADKARAAFLEHIERSERYAPAHTDLTAYRAVLDDQNQERNP